MVSRWATAIVLARSNPSAIRIGWMPLSRRISACSSSAPARTTTPVVPSPISSSCDFESWTSNLAISCWTSIWSRMVAPSLVTVISPSGEIKILSRPCIIQLTKHSPRGPKEDLMMFVTTRAAKMCAYYYGKLKGSTFWAAMPDRRAFLSCSRRIMNGRPSVNDRASKLTVFVCRVDSLHSSRVHLKQ